MQAAGVPAYIFPESAARALAALHRYAHRLAGSGDEAVEAARELGFPVVLKVVSPQIVHKTDAGGVRLDLRSEDDVREAYALLFAGVAEREPDAEIRGSWWPRSGKRAAS